MTSWDGIFLRRAAPFLYQINEWTSMKSINYRLFETLYTSFARISLDPISESSLQTVSKRPGKTMFCKDDLTLGTYYLILQGQLSTVTLDYKDTWSQRSMSFKNMSRNFNNFIFQIWTSNSSITSGKHHVLRIEHLLRQLRHGQRTVLLGATRRKRREAVHEEMQPQRNA